MWHCAARLLDYILFERNIIIIYLLSKHSKVVVAKIIFISKVEKGVRHSADASRKIIFRND